MSLSLVAEVLYVFAVIIFYFVIIAAYTHIRYRTLVAACVGVLAGGMYSIVQSCTFEVSSHSIV